MLVIGTREIRWVFRLSRRADSNCRPAVYEFVLSRTSESLSVHLLLISCQAVPVDASPSRAAGVRSGLHHMTPRRRESSTSYDPTTTSSILRPLKNGRCRGRAHTHVLRYPRQLTPAEALCRYCGCMRANTAKRSAMREPDLAGEIVTSVRGELPSSRSRIANGA